MSVTGAINRYFVVTASFLVAFVFACCSCVTARVIGCLRCSAAIRRRANDAETVALTDLNSHGSCLSNSSDEFVEEYRLVNHNTSHAINKETIFTTRKDKNYQKYKAVNPQRLISTNVSLSIPSKPTLERNKHATSCSSVRRQPKADDVTLLNVLKSSIVPSKIRPDLLKSSDNPDKKFDETSAVHNDVHKSFIEPLLDKSGHDDKMRGARKKLTDLMENHVSKYDATNQPTNVEKHKVTDNMISVAMGGNWSVNYLTNSAHDDKELSTTLFSSTNKV